MLRIQVLDDGRERATFVCDRCGRERHKTAPLGRRVKVDNAPKNWTRTNDGVGFTCACRLSSDE